MHCITWGLASSTCGSGAWESWNIASPTLNFKVTATSSMIATCRSPGTSGAMVPNSSKKTLRIRWKSQPSGEKAGMSHSRVEESMQFAADVATWQQAISDAIAGIAKDAEQATAAAVHAFVDADVADYRQPNIQEWVQFKLESSEEVDTEEFDTLHLDSSLVVHVGEQQAADTRQEKEGSLGGSSSGEQSLLSTPNHCNGSSTIHASIPSTSGADHSTGLTSTALSMQRKQQQQRWSKRKPRRSPRQPAWSSESVELRQSFVMAEICSLPPTADLSWVLMPRIGQLTRVDLLAVQKKLGQRGEVDRAVALFRWMMKQKGRLRPNSFAYSSTISILGRHGRLEEARVLFAEFLLSGIGPAVHVYNAMLAVLIERRHFRDAWALFQRMLENSALAASAASPSSSSASLSSASPSAASPSASSASLSSASSSAAIATASSSSAASATAPAAATATADIASVGPNGRTAAASTRSSSDLHSSHLGWVGVVHADVAGMSSHAAGGEGSRLLVPDETTFNIVLWGCSQARVPSSRALHLFELMRTAGLQPDRRTFNALITCLAREGRCEEVEQQFEEMRRQGIPPDIFTINSLVGMYGRAGSLGDAINILNEAQEAGLSLTAHSFTSLMSAFCQAGRHRDAIDTFEKMQQAGVEADVAAYCALIGAFRKAGLVEEAAAAFEEMESKGLKPNTFAYTSLMQAYGMQGMYEEAEKVFQQMEKAGCHIDLRCFNILMDAYGQEGLSFQTARLFRQLQARGLRPDAVTYNVLIHAYSKAGLAGEAEKAYRQMTAAGIPADSVTKGLLVRTFHEAGWHEKADAVWKERKNRGQRLEGRKQWRGCREEDADKQIAPFI